MNDIEELRHRYRSLNSSYEKNGKLIFPLTDRGFCSYQTLSSSEIVELLKRASEETEIEERAYDLLAESCVGDGRGALILQFPAFK